MRSALEPLRQLGRVASNARLRRLLIAYSLFSVCELGTWVAILVFAFERGGTAEAGFVSVVQLVPSAILAPIASTFGDRFRRDRYLVAGYASEAVSMLLVGVAMAASAPVVLVYALAAVAASSITLTRPAQAAILPSVVRTPDELTASNVVVSAIESGGVFAGPFAAGVVLAIGTPADVFLGAAGALAVSTVVSLGLGAVPPIGEAEPAGWVSASLAGFRALLDDRAARTLVWLIAAESTVVGFWTVGVVALAIDVLGLGSPGAGFLTSSAGVGGIVGSVGAAVLIGRRLARPIVVALALMGASILLGGLAPNALGAAAAFAVVGGVAVTVHAGTQTLLQRAVDDEVLSRVFGVLEGVWAGTLAIGAASAPFLVRAFGVRGAFVAAGAALVAVALAGSTRLRRIDDAVDVPAERIELLGSIPMFEPLPAQALERIARRLRPVAFEPGTTIIEQGEPGDVLYVVSSGEVDTLVDGAAKGYRGPREYFGEIALLRDVPRTATVRARTAVTAFTLDRAAFLAALTGEPAVRAMAESGAAVRLRR